MIIYRQTGNAFWATKNTMIINLINAADRYIRQLEKQYFGAEAPACAVDLDYSDYEAFKKTDPWSNSSGSAPAGMTSMTF